MTRISFCLLAGTLVLNFACQRRDNTRTAQERPMTERPATQASTERAYVRFINADATKEKLDLYFGDGKAFSGIGYRQVTAYQPMPTERGTFRVRVPEMSSDLATNSEGLWAGRYYTLLAAAKNNGETTLDAISDGFDAPSAGKAKVRVINASTNAGDVDLWVAGTRNELLDGVDPDSASSFKEVDPTTAAIEVRRDDKKGMPVKVADMPIQAGKLYTVLVTGDRNKLTATPIEEPLNRDTASR